MTPQEIIDNNILLAEFLGAELEETESNLFVYCLEMPDHTDLSGYKKEFYEPSELQFHCNFNWLIEVIKVVGVWTEYELVIRHDCSYWNRYGENPFSGPGDPAFGGYSDIINIYEACVAFVKWYNQNKGGN